ncbi:hypothetical protein LZ496_08840 [Sphingomonas sp. NSE70-1]|uniref:Uncharacterized protein n=1 Tax=Sphingomonas caseinilyticus TaxID=2908205 RepID=A0ABT0RV25_9SPHN|nr:hypothetical protein [Sphingomonas caseinilyticus]MCL6698884.1 hypothetical protein [Sphingomonas caseinilyticus]
MTDHGLELTQKKRSKGKRAVRPRLSDAGQFSFDLQHNALKQIVIVAMDEIDGVHLRQLLDVTQPKYLLDLRHVVRFDNPGSSRDHFFNHLSKTKSLYTRDPIAWHSIDTAPLSVDADMLPARVRYEVVEQHDNNVMLLVSKPTESRKLASVLNLALSRDRATNWVIHIT